jgi:hypothetical protein
MCQQQMSEDREESNEDFTLNGLIRLVREALPEDFISKGCQREIGVLAIAFWHHFIGKVAAKRNVQIPPVLISTLSTIFALFLTKNLGGKEFGDNVVSYFEPGVNFLGTWMPLWLAPPLVMLPKALQSIKGANANVWVKLVLVHYGLWAASTVGTAKLFELIDGSSSEKRNASVDAPQGNASSSSTESAANNLRRKQLKVFRFWFGVTVAFHAAAASGTTVAAAAVTPALASSTIAALSGGILLPKGVKKVVHPLLLAALISALSAVITDRWIKQKQEGSWIDSLSTYLRGSGSGEMRSVHCAVSVLMKCKVTTDCY